MLFSASRSHMGPETWENLLKLCALAQGPEELPGILARHAAGLGLPDYLPELARLEWAVNEASSSRGREGHSQDFRYDGHDISFARLQLRLLPLLAALNPAATPPRLAVLNINSLSAGLL